MPLGSRQPGNPPCRWCGKPMPHYRGFAGFDFFGQGKTDAEARAILESRGIAWDRVRKIRRLHNNNVASIDYDQNRFGYAGNGVFCTMGCGFAYAMHHAVENP